MKTYIVAHYLTPATAALAAIIKSRSLDLDAPGFGGGDENSGSLIFAFRRDTSLLISFPDTVDKYLDVRNNGDCTFESKLEKQARIIFGSTDYRIYSRIIAFKALIQLKMFPVNVSNTAYI